MERPNFCKRVSWDVMLAWMVMLHDKNIFVHVLCTPCYIMKVFVYVSCGFYDFQKAGLLSPQAYTKIIKLPSCLVAAATPPCS